MANESGRDSDMIKTLETTRQKSMCDGLSRQTVKEDVST